MWYVYILECQNGDLYTGITNNVERRFIEHHQRKGGKFTRYSGTNKLLYSESFLTALGARNREVQIKGWTRRKKLALAAGDLKRLKEI